MNKEIKKLIAQIWKKKKAAFHWIYSHFDKPYNFLTSEDKKILLYLLTVKAKTGNCPILEHEENNKKRRRRVIYKNSKNWKNLRLKVFERDGGKCSICGNESSLTIDHIIPIFEGGTNSLENLRLLCIDCHNKKNKDEYIRAEEKSEQVGLRSNNYALAKKYYQEHMRITNS